jgi:hypothetical protein
MGSDYVFVTVWRVPARPSEIAAVLEDVASLPRWWPSVYLDVRPLPAVGDRRSVEMLTKGRLPYTLHWTSTVDGPVTDAGFALTATGDLAGTGRWSFVADGPETVITYEWRITATKPLLRRLGWLLRPAFAANHRWAMARGEESLRLEVRRRRAPDAAALAAVPDPPGPTFGRRPRRLVASRNHRPPPR